MTHSDSLSIFVAEAIMTRDVPPGTSTPTAATHTAEDLRTKKEEAVSEKARLLARYVEPHKNKSRWVTLADIDRLIVDGRDMADMCTIPRGLGGHAMALAHSQITTDPLRFFIFLDGNAVINPVITIHTKAYVYKDDDACMSFPQTRPKKETARFNKITVTFQRLGVRKGETTPIITAPVTEEHSGRMAHIFQHECDHLNGGYVFDEDYAPERAIGFGDGAPVDPSIWEPKVEISDTIK